MRVLYVTFFYPPETGAASIRTVHHVRALRAAGHDVSVLAPLPNYPSGEIFPEWQGRIQKHDPIEGVRRVWIRPSLSPKPWSRLMPYATFNVSGFLGALWTRLRGARIDVIAATSPPIPAMTFLAPLSLLLRAPLVLDLRDIWPDLGLHMGVLREGSLETRVTGMVERLLLRRARRCAVTAEGDRDNLLAKGVPANHVLLVPNGADTEQFTPDGALPREERLRRFGGRDGFSVIYAGSFNFAMNDMELLADIARDIANTRPQYTLYLAGAGRALPTIKEAVRSSQNPDAVCFIDPLPHAELAPLVASCDVGIVPLRNVPDTGGNVPVKMFEYWAAGLPVALGVHRESSTLPIFERVRAGVHFESSSSAAAIEALDQLAAMSPAERRRIGASGREFVQREYSRQTWSRRFAEAVEDAVASGA